MDYEALKEQWSDVEERDGIRLSWNVFPSSRMVRTALEPTVPCAPKLTDFIGSLATRGAHWSSVHTSEREGGLAPASVRASCLQTAMPLCPKPFLVSSTALLH